MNTILFYISIAMTILAFGLILILLSTMMKLIDSMRSDIRLLFQENAQLRYANRALVREIDYHLHNNSDELATSYFSNCREIRESVDPKTQDSYMIWGNR